MNVLISKKIVLIIVVFAINLNLKSQNTIKSDTTIINKYIKNAMDVAGSKPDSSIYYYQKAILNIKKLNNQDISKSIISRFEERHGFVLHQIGNAYMAKADYAMSLDFYHQSIVIRKKINDLKGLSNSYNNMGLIFYYIGNTDSSFFYYKKSLNLRQNLKDTVAVTASLDNMAMLYEDIGLVDSALYYYKQCLELYQSKQLHSQIVRTFNNIGIVYKNRGDIPNAIQYYSKGLKIAEQKNDSSNMANLYANMGQVYKIQEDEKKALYFYEKSLLILTSLNDLRRKAQILHNIAAIFHDKINENIQLENYNSNDSLFEITLSYYNQALEIKQKINDKHGVATSLLDIGNLKYEMTKVKNINSLKIINFKEEALMYFQKSIEYYSEINNSSGLTYAYNTIANYYYENNDMSKALIYATYANKIGKKSGYLESIKNSAEVLKNIYKKQGNFKLAFQYFNEFITLRDSIAKEENFKLAQQQYYQTLYEKQAITDSIAHADQMSIKNLEISHNQEKMKRQSLIIFFSIFGLIAVVAFLFVLYRMFLQKKKANVLLNQQNTKIMNLNKVIKKEKDTSENLLLNILPFETALELKEKGEAVPRYYESVSVLFTDFKGFTKACTGLTPQEIVSELHMYFGIFDSIIEKYHLEKIKTIGDAYMCAGGLPIENNTHPVDIVKAGLEMQEFMKNLKIQRIKDGLPYWELRLGIHTGSVVAGVVGKKKFAYDIWGSAVNIASRMESGGEPGKVNISASTQEFVKDLFSFEHRGKIEAKNLGAIDMFFVEKKIS